MMTMSLIPTRTPSLLANLTTPILRAEKPLVLVWVEVDGKMECRWVEDTP